MPSRSSRTNKKTTGDDDPNFLDPDDDNDGIGFVETTIEDNADVFIIDSFFDVFVEVDIAPTATIRLEPKLKETGLIMRDVAMKGSFLFVLASLLGNKTQHGLDQTGGVWDFGQKPAAAAGFGSTLWFEKAVNLVKPQLIADNFARETNRVDKTS